MGNDKFGPEGPKAPGLGDARQARRLVRALAALEKSAADEPTLQETHRLRREVIEATVALERRQRAR